MKRMRTMIIVFSICAIVFGGNLKEAEGGGIPVIDAANLAQQLTEYLTILLEFEEMIGQTFIQTDQYMQMVEDYRQVLREYQHYLRQLEGIKHMISSKDWRSLMRIITYYRGKSKRSVVTVMDPDDRNYEEELNTVLENYGHVPRDPAAVAADAQALGIWSDQYRKEVEEDYRNFNLYKDRMRMVSDNAKKSQERLNEEMAIHIENMNNLGDESDLATMQQIAAENITIMNQLESQIQIQNQMLMNMETEAARRAARRAKAREAELERLKNRKPTQLLGRDRWGSF